ncbi:uncharacterized protein ATNIH1004_006980 [Aspergillus tanneri]|uniref:Uncharacterized protein n=1 Tax=Aspergillus tanneri TaxID=1220188 RepID=A0A5M9MF45_9EURO|nr:uncharacterized protein ATNIH1004_006980 [Aspergillus tanneri]KAA8645561.1 hypothetical protein ATNIH1004_006980 [Aspergillus tanneri]
MEATQMGIAKETTLMESNLYRGMAGLVPVLGSEFLVIALCIKALVYLGELQYVSRWGPYSQIYLQSTPEESGVSNEVHSHTRSRQETQDVPPRGLSEHCNYRLRSCAYILKEKDARKRLITLATSAVFLILVLALYLVFAVSNSILGRELHILLVFMILILAIVFCHSLIRLAMVILRSPTNQIPRRAGPTGYAQPERPIQVVLAGDEVLTESNSNNREKVVAPPPAYGLWRSSVRINPDLLYWQRVERNARPLWNHINKAEPTSSNKIATPRPPSYTSDNGIDYVVEAQPRSFTRCHIAEEPEHR